MIGGLRKYLAVCATLGLVAGGCSSDQNPPLVANTQESVSATASPVTSASSVTITGEIALEVQSDGPQYIFCVDALSDAGPLNLTFKDGDGNVIGSESLLLDALKGPPEDRVDVLGSEPYIPCVGRRSYETTVPETDFYQVEVSGYNTLTTSLADLEANGFRLDITLE